LPPSEDDNFDKAENATQKRIDRLTKKMREAERQREEALKYAQGVQAEAQQLKQRMDTLDTNYVNEYSSRVESQIAPPKKNWLKLLRWATQTALLRLSGITRLAIENDRAQTSKSTAATVCSAGSSSAAGGGKQPMPQQQPRSPDPKAEQWAQKNDWFGEDEAMTYAAFGIHKKLVEDEGFDPQSNDYYNELDQAYADRVSA
jgi:hypothetical protein